MNPATAAHSPEQQHGTEEREWIVAVDSIKQACHQMSGKERRWNAQHEADQNLARAPHASPWSPHSDRVAPSAMRMPISAGAPGYEVGHHSVETDRSQDQRKNAEYAGEPRDQSILIEVAGDLGIVSR